MWPDRVSNPWPLPFESDALPTALRGPAVYVCVCVCEREKERERGVYSHVSGGKFYFEKIIAIFSGGKNLLHVRGKASIPFEWLSRHLYLPTCIRKFCHAINSTALEKMLLKYAAFRESTLFVCLIKKKVRNFKAYFLAWQRAALKSFWVRIMVFSEKMVCIHNSADGNAVIRMGTV